MIEVIQSIAIEISESVFSLLKGLANCAKSKEIFEGFGFLEIYSFQANYVISLDKETKCGCLRADLLCVLLVSQ